MTRKRGQLAIPVLKERGHFSCMPTRNDTLSLPCRFSLTFGKTSLIRRDTAVTQVLEPGKLFKIIECSIDNCTD